MVIDYFATSLFASCLPLTMCVCVCQYKIYKKSKCIRSKILNVIQIFQSLQQIAFDGGLNNGSRSPHPLPLVPVFRANMKKCSEGNASILISLHFLSFIHYTKLIIQVQRHATCVVLPTLTILLSFFNLHIFPMPFPNNAANLMICI